jgi:hypothetical protein
MPSLLLAMRRLVVAGMRRRGCDGVRLKVVQQKGVSCPTMLEKKAKQGGGAFIQGQELVVCCVRHFRDVAYPLPIFSAFHAKPPAFPSKCGASVTLIQEWNSSEKFGITDIPMPWESPTGKKAYLVFLHGRTSGAVPAALALIVRRYFPIIMETFISIYTSMHLLPRRT